MSPTLGPASTLPSCKRDLADVTKLRNFGDYPALSRWAKGGQQPPEAGKDDEEPPEGRQR